MELQVGENRVGISFESLMWFLALTAVGTVAGGILYAYIQPYLPNLPTGFLPSNATPPSQVNNPTMGRLSRLGYVPRMGRYGRY